MLLLVLLPLVLVHKQGLPYVLASVNLIEKYENKIIYLYCIHPVVCCILVFLMYQSTQQFLEKQISTTVLAFIYCVEVLLHVATLLGHHKAIIT
jgi:small-conductance mechanosensitive channel